MPIRYEVEGAPGIQPAGGVGVHGTSDPIDPFAKPTDPLIGPDTFDPNSYIGVPEGYEKLIGYQPSPTGRYGAHIAAGQVPDPVPIYREPIYQYEHLAKFTQLDQESIASWQMRLYNMGFLDEGSMNGIGIMNEGTYEAMQAAMATANQNGMNLTQLERNIIAGRPVEKAMGFTSSGGYGSGSTNPYEPTTTTSTSTSTSTQENVSLTGRGGARAVLVNAMATEMGREPTPNEVRRFLRSLHAAERRNPSRSRTTSTTTSTTTTDRDRSGDTSVDTDTDTDTRTVSRQSNVDPTQKAEKFAEQIGGKEAERFQAANFFSVIEQMVGL